MAKIKGNIVVDTERCKGCNVCVSNCPTDAISLHLDVNSKGYHFCFLSDIDKCIGCAGYAITCPDGCITVYKQKFD